MVPKAFRLGVGIFILSSLLFGFANCGRFALGGSGEPYEGVDIGNGGHQIGLTPEFGYPESNLVCRTTSSVYMNLSMQVRFDLAGRPIIALQRQNGSAIELIFNGAPNNSVLIPISLNEQINAIQYSSETQIAQLLVQNNLTKTTVTVKFPCMRASSQ